MPHQSAFYECTGLAKWTKFVKPLLSAGMRSVNREMRILALARCVFWLSEFVLV